jgi:adenine-specific DNA methylase
MTSESNNIDKRAERKREELPIERGFPIEQVNDLADKEGRAKMHYRPITTMHKWWARRLGCVFRTISLYALLDDPEKVDVHEYTEDINGTGEGTVQTSLSGGKAIAELIENVDMSNPDSLWELYRRDVRVQDKKVLDPFMGGGTSLLEASRFGAAVDGRDLNPVAWFVTKKEVEAGQTDIAELNEAFDEVQEQVAEDIKEYYKTPCPSCDESDSHHADVMYYFWVKELDCVACGENVPLFRDYRVGKGRYGEDKGKYNVLCPHCESVTLVDDWQDENSVCNACHEKFDPSAGNSGRGNYNCPDCGQKYGVVDAIQEQGGFNLRLYGLEYYCPICDEQGKERSEVRGYRGTTDTDRENFDQAKKDWEDAEELREYIPYEKIPIGIKTDSTKFEGSIGGGFNVIRHGYEDWSDMFNERQLYCLSSLLRAIGSIENQNAKEYLLLALSDALRTNCMMVSYDSSRNGIDHIFRDNNFNPPLYPTENNVWGTNYGRGTFQKSWKMVLDGVRWAASPTERYINEEGDTKETPSFSKSVGEDVNIKLGDAREVGVDSEYDAVITDPPYYDNVIYSELSNFFYVWLKILLEDEYDGFEAEKTPMADSIVSNPAVNKGVEEFEDEIRQAFSAIHNALKDEGVLSFTYHHSDSESWGELLQALCDVGFEVTSAYPITADISKLPAKLGKGDSVSFDIIVVARPAEKRTEIHWRDLQRDIVRTARSTRKTLEETRDLSIGDIGVIEMGECFREYSKHHDKVIRDGEIMDAKEVVEEIYGIIQEGSEESDVDTFLRLLENDVEDYDTVNKLVRGTATSIDELEDRRLIETNGEVRLGTWENERRIEYIQERANGDGSKLSPLAKAQLLRYKYEIGASVQNQLDAWSGMDSELHDMLSSLAEATGDDTYNRIIEGNYSLGTFGGSESE